MEDNNSFLEPEIESSLSEEVDKPAEELSDLEYKEIVGEDEAYIAELLPDSSEIDLLIQDRKTLINKKKKSKKKKKPKKSGDEDEGFADIDEEPHHDYVSSISNKDPVHSKEKPIDKKWTAGKQEEAPAKKYKINTIEELSHHINELPKDKPDAEELVAAAETRKFHNADVSDSKDTGSFSEEITHKESAIPASQKEHSKSETFSIYYLNNSKERSEKGYADYRAQSFDKRLNEKEIPDRRKEAGDTEKASDIKADGGQISGNSEKHSDSKKEDYSRKFRISGEKIPISESIANAGKTMTSAVMLQGVETDSIDSEQGSDFYRISTIVNDVWESLGQMGLKASARMAKDAAQKLEKNTAKTAELVGAGQISIDQLRSNEKAKVFSRKLKESGVNKKTARYISRHRQEIADAIEAKIELSEFAEKTKKVENVFAKTKVRGKNVILLSKWESDRQKKLLREDNTRFFDLYKSGSLNKNMIKTYFSYHEDELLRKMNPQKMNKKDLKKFIKKIETGKIHVSQEHKDRILPLLRTYERSKRIREIRRFGKRGFFRTLSGRVILRNIDDFKYSDDATLEGIRNTSHSIRTVIAAKEFTRLSAYALSRIHRINKKINPVLIAGRVLHKRVVKPAGAKAVSKAKVKVAASAPGRTYKKGIGKAAIIKKNAKLLVKKSAPYKAIEKSTGFVKNAGKTVSKIRNVKAVRKSASAIKRTTRIGKKVGQVILIPFIPVRFVKAGIGKVYMALRKVAIWTFVALFLIILLLVGMLLLSATIQSIVASQGTLFESTILDEKMSDRISRLKDKDLQKYQEAIDIATSPPKHDADHVDSKGLYPDEAYFGVKLYHYGSPESPSDPDAGIYHNDIPGSETKNGYHIYFLDSEGKTIGNSTTNIKDVLCLSAVMADNYYDDKHTDKITDLQDEIFDKLNPKPIYKVSELYNKEGNDRFPYDGKTFDQKTYYCNDDSVYSAASSAKSEGVMFYKELSPKTQSGCTFDEESYDTDFDSWLDDMPYLSDYLPSWSDYAPNIDDYEDADGNVDFDSYNAAYEAAEEAYDAAYELGEHNYNSAYSTWQGNKPDINDEQYNYCPGHPVPGADNTEEDPISVSYGYRDINIYVTVLTKEDVYKAYDSGTGIIKYKTPKNYECTEFEENEIEFSLSGSYGEMLDEFYRNDGWKSKKNRSWCDELYNNDWEDIYGTDVYSDSTNLPSGKGALSDQQIKEIIESLGDVSEVRQAYVNYALSYVGQIPYYWGGKPAVPGFEGNGFGTTVDADYKGRTKKGLDCSGFVSWCYWSVTGIKPPGMSTSNFTNGLHLTQVSFSEIKPGDVGFISPPGAKSNHIGIFAGFDEATGRAKWVHCAGEPRNTVVCDTTNKFSIYYRLFD
ncbi:NlpC/P60 family protein [Butyrivibrio sp. INlla16]|uniref:C40 family peptidase n=1 Tax=Butyrivibrio sp. INlla16 TaxID=1520807 RepID=UPI000885108B|nr:NlpC/P60 family protein [Butyrivibrio sp. INlla16]SDB56477.1 NlpC/P60 family protein [Butyrivibrio sp. INlla16]